jgi:BlaI family transcriptional regulator, penicillinase repressor
MGQGERDVTEAELAVLQALWDAPAGGGGAGAKATMTIRHLTDRLYPGGGVSRYATVQKLLERLEAKGCVRRDAAAVPHTFAAAVTRDELIGRRLRGVADALCGGSFAPLLTNLVRAKPLKPKEIDELRSLIDQLDRKPPPPPRKRR